jgi:hypothetical protein
LHATWSAHSAAASAQESATIATIASSPATTSPSSTALPKRVSSRHVLALTRHAQQGEPRPERLSRGVLLERGGLRAGHGAAEAAPLQLPDACARQDLGDDRVGGRPRLPFGDQRLLGAADVGVVAQVDVGAGVRAPLGIQRPRRRHRMRLVMGLRGISPKPPGYL